MSPRAAASAAGTRRLGLVVHLGFALTGLVTTLLGPLLPWLSQRWGLDDSRAGALFTAEFAGSIAGVAAAGALLPRRGFVGTILLGLGLSSAGVGALSVTGYALGLVAVFVFGFGLGLTGPGFNLWIAETQAHRRAAALSLLNMAWAAGATSAPAAVALLAARGLLDAFLPGLSLLIVVVGTLLFVAARRFRSLHVEAPPPHAPLPRAFWTSRPALMFAALFFSYVGIEHALGGWAATCAQRLGGGAGGAWAAVPSFFWGALVMGRALVPPLLVRFEEAAVAVGSLTLALAGTTTLLLAQHPALVTLAMALAGLGLAPVFPVTTALLSHYFGARAARVAGPMFGMGSLGGALVPWFVGVVSSHSDSLRAGLALTWLGALALLLLYRGLQRAMPHVPPE